MSVLPEFQFTPFEEGCSLSFSFLFFSLSLTNFVSPQKLSNPPLNGSLRTTILLVLENYRCRACFFCLFLVCFFGLKGEEEGGFFF